MGEDKCRFERRIKLDNQPHEWSFCSFYTRGFANDKDGRIKGVQGDLIILIIKLKNDNLFFLLNICVNEIVLKKLESMCLYISNTYNLLKKLLKLK